LPHSVQCVTKKEYIIDYDLKKNYPILTILVHVGLFLTHLTIKWPFSYSPRPTPASALPSNKKPSCR